MVNTQGLATPETTEEKVSVGFDGSLPHTITNIHVRRAKDERHEADIFLICSCVLNSQEGEEYMWHVPNLIVSGNVSSQKTSAEEPEMWHSR